MRPISFQSWSAFIFLEKLSIYSRFPPIIPHFHSIFLQGFLSTFVFVNRFTGLSVKVNRKSLENEK